MERYSNWPLLFRVFSSFFIPIKKLDAAAKKKGKMGQRARLAKTLRGFKK